MAVRPHREARRDRGNLDQVPLTLEDVLFPEVGDFIVAEFLTMSGDLVYLKSVFDFRLAGDLLAEVFWCTPAWT